MDNVAPNGKKTASLPSVRSDDRPTDFRVTETVKGELLDQLDQLGELACRLEAVAEQFALTSPADESVDEDLPGIVNSIPRAAGEMIPFAREVLADYSASLSEEDLAEAQRRIRHDLRNKLNPIYILSQEAGFIAPPESIVAEAAEELQTACEAAISILDFLTGRISQKPESHSAEHRPKPVAVSTIEPAASQILVADDNAISADQLRRHLVRHGHTVYVVHNGRDVLSVLEQRPEIDLVLLDMIMPEMDGFEVLSWIKRHSDLRNVPVIVISGLDDSTQVVKCIEAGAEDYLAKPINTVLLDARVKSCLRRRQAEEHRLQQYFSRDLAKELACSHSGDLLRTRDADVSVLFCDLRRFSSISERVGAKLTIEWIRDTMAKLTRIVFSQEGVLIEYTGDGLMAMWGAPQEDQHDHADRAVRTGLEMLDAIGPIRKEWEPRLNDTVELGVGINSGTAQVGIIGAPPKFKYGPLGSTVNLASRIEGTTKYLKTSLIISENTCRKLGCTDNYTIRRLCRAGVVNVSEPVKLYEVRSSDEDLEPVCRTYQEALGLYESQRFDEAARVLGRLLATQHDLNDVPTQLLLSRVLAAMADETNYDPVWQFGK